MVRDEDTPKGHVFYTTDFTGDGRDDLMINKLGYTSTGGYNVEYFKLYKSIASGSYFNFTYDIKYPYSSQSCSGIFNTFPAQIGDGQYFYPGDFDGDGASDYVTILSNQTGFKAFLSFPEKNIYNQEVTNINAGCYAQDMWVHSDDRAVIEFDGDGRQELMLIKGNYTKIFSFKKSGSNWIAEEKYSAGFPTKWHFLHFGDFNGDGKTDILHRTSKTDHHAPWYKAINTGVGFIETPFSFQTQPDIEDEYSDEKLIISDFNGDGKTDIFHGWGYFVGNTATSVLPHKFFDISFDCINEFFNIISFSDSPIKNRS